MKHIYLIEIGDRRIEWVFTNYTKAFFKANELTKTEPMIEDAIPIDKNNWDAWKYDTTLINCWAQKGDIERSTYHCHRMYIRKIEITN